VNAANLSRAALILTLVSACRSQPQPSDRTSTAMTLAADTAAPDTQGCALVAQKLHPAPRRLLEEFLERDARGEFLSANAWDAGAHSCPGREAGWDAATVITSYQLDSLRLTPDAARYLVTYHVYGPLSDDSMGGLSVTPGVEIDTFLLLRTAYGWRIDSPSLDPHVLPKAALGLQLRMRDRRLLDSLAAR
jgi:hypothetical protein